MAVDARRDPSNGRWPMATASSALEPAWVAQGLPAAGPAPRCGRGGLRSRRSRRAVRALAGVDDEGRQPGRSRRRRVELSRGRWPRPDHAEGGGGDGAGSRSWARSTRRPTRPRPAGEDLRLRAPAAAAPAPAAGARRARRAATPRTRRTTSLPAWTWGPTRRRSSACIRRSSRTGTTSCCCRTSNGGTATGSCSIRLPTPGRRGGVPHPLGRAPRAGDRADDRAAGGLGRVRDAPGANVGESRSRRICCGRTCGRRIGRPRASGSSSI